MMPIELSSYPKGVAANQLMRVRAAAPLFGVTEQVLETAIRNNNVPGYFALGHSGEPVWFVSREIVEAYSNG